MYMYILLVCIFLLNSSFLFIYLYLYLSHLMISVAPPNVQSIIPNVNFFRAVDGSINIQCSIVGPSNSIISWFHNGTILTADDRIKIVTLSFSLSSLTISDIVLNDSGVYSCNVSSGAGFHFVSVEVTVGGEL